jgi:hypothetical protein
MGCLCPGCAYGGGCWYKKGRWKQTSAFVRARDPYCYVVDCPEPVRAADHIDPVSPATTMAEFHDVSRLRGSCRRHNTARGVAARLERELAGGVRPAPRRYSIGGSRTVKRDAAGGTHTHARGMHGFLGGGADYDSPVAVSLSPKRYPLVTADYSRIPMQSAGKREKAG